MSEYIKTVEELIYPKEEITYFIPDYQRGYRWQANDEVHTLLEDIRTFETEHYCLQPIVVKKRASGDYEVVDGQQRLTTLYLLCKCLGHEPTCTITYATREESADFLKNIASKGQTSECADFYFMSCAYKKISEEIKNNKNELDSQLKKVQVIWYEAPKADDGYALFTRLNSYRIALTDAELIRALFLKRSQDIDESLQFEMATEWDQMERELRNSAFWYFLTSEKEEKYSSRLELIFRIMALSSESEAKVEKYGVFKMFSKTITNHQNAKELWQRVSNCFNTLHDWYRDPELYHLIGYLVSAKSVGKGKKISMMDLVQEWLPAYRLEPDSGKTCIPQAKICDKALEKIRLILPKKEAWKDLRYGKNDNDIHNILLLFNIVYTKDRGNEENRFPFEGYRKVEWSLEHIHPQNPNMDDLRENFVSWWDEHKKDLLKNDLLNDQTKKICEKIDKQEELTDDELKDLFKCVMACGLNDGERSEYETLMVENERDMLNNMALLQKHINSSLQNYSFSVKRKKIIGRDAPTDNKNKEFILPCTLNVFLKYYSDAENALKMDMWDVSDRDAYYQAIVNTFNKYKLN